MNNEHTVGSPQDSTGGMPENHLIDPKDTSTVPEMIYTAGKLERIIEIKRLLLQHGCLTAANIAASMRVPVHEKTARRDIEFMRTRMDVDIESTPEGYRLTGPIGLLPGEKVSDTDVAGAVFATKLMERFRGMTWHGPALNIIQSYLVQADRQQQKLQKNLTPSIYFQQPDLLQETDPVLFQTILDGFLNGQPMHFLYRKPLDIFRPRLIDPYVLTAWENCWYLLGRDHGANGIRTFKLFRMREARLSAQRFVMPGDFDPKKYYDKSLGIFVSEGDHEVVVWLSPWLTDSLDDRGYRAWKKWDKQADGSSIVTMHLSCLEEAQRWVLGWAENTKVIGPQILIDSTVKKLRKALALYEAQPGQSIVPSP